MPIANIDFEFWHADDSTGSHRSKVRVEVIAGVCRVYVQKTEGRGPFPVFLYGTLTMAESPSASASVSASPSVSSSASPSASPSVSASASPSTSASASPSTSASASSSVSASTSPS